jgi:hypothetical protein
LPFSAGKLVSEAFRPFRGLFPGPDRIESLLFGFFPPFVAESAQHLRETPQTLLTKLVQHVDKSYFPGEGEPGKPRKVASEDGDVVFDVIFQHEVDFDLTKPATQPAIDKPAYSNGEITPGIGVGVVDSGFISFETGAGSDEKFGIVGFHSFTSGFSKKTT